MEYTTLGATGMTVSRICLGCMSFGSPDWRDWVLEEDEARPIIEHAIDLGINFFDTANVYSHGESERILGNVLADYDPDWPVVATKVYNEMNPDNPNASGLSRKTIEQELQNSLRRLDRDTIDLYQTHRWDYDTPIAETLRALNDAVRRNQVRYLGASSMWAYQLATAHHTSHTHSLERFVSMQNHYNLTYREEEREVIPLCEQEDIGLIPWSPLGRGYLARPDAAAHDTTRGRFMQETTRYAERIQTYRANGGTEINRRVSELAEDKDATMAQIALAWLLHQDAVTAPIVGTTNTDHLDDAVAALDITLSASDQDYLEEPYEPGPIDGHH